MNAIIKERLDFILFDFFVINQKNKICIAQLIL